MVSFTSLPKTLLAFLLASPVLSAPTTPNDPFRAIAAQVPKQPDLPICCLKPLPPLEPVEEENVLLSFEDWKTKQFALQAVAKAKANHKETLIKSSLPAHTGAAGSGPPSEGKKETTGEFVIPETPLSATPDGNTSVQDVPESPSEELSSPHFRVPLHDRFNYASLDCSARVHKTHRSAKSAASILSSKRDRYMLSPCTQGDQHVVVELCDDIRIDTVQLANFEFFSGVFKDFTVSVAKTYTNDAAGWTVAGTYRAKNVRGVQSFHPPTTLRDFYRYIRIDFHSHYSNEYYCPVSLLRVYGLTHLEQWKWEVWESESTSRREVEWEDRVDVPTIVVDDEPQLAHVPVIDEVNSGEDAKVTNYPSHAGHADESDTQQDSVIDGSGTSDMRGADVQRSSPDSDLSKGSLSHPQTSTVSIDTLSPGLSSGLHSQELGPSPPSARLEQDIGRHNDNDYMTHETATTHVPSFSVSYPDTPTTITSTSTSLVISGAGSPSVLYSLNVSTATSGSHTSRLPSSESKLAASTASLRDSSHRLSSPSSTTTAHVSSSHHHIVHTSPPASSLSALMPHSPPPQVTGGESIYRTIMNRLTALEANHTLYALYMEEQTAGVREALRRLGEDVGRLEGLSKAQAQMYQRTIHEWEKQRRRLEMEHGELISRVNYLADEIVLEKRLGIAQLCILLAVLVFMGLTRGSRGEAILQHKPLPQLNLSMREWGRRNLSFSGDWASRFRSRSPAPKLTQQRNSPAISIDTQVEFPTRTPQSRPAQPSGSKPHILSNDKRLPQSTAPLRSRTPTSSRTPSGRHLALHLPTTPTSRPQYARSNSGSGSYLYGQAVGVGPVPRSAKRWARSAHLHQVRAGPPGVGEAARVHHRNGVDRTDRENDTADVFRTSMSLGDDTHGDINILDATPVNKKGKTLQHSHRRPMSPLRFSRQQSETEESMWVDTDADGSEISMDSVSPRESI